MGFFRNLSGVMKKQMRNPNPQSQMMPLPPQSQMMPLPNQGITSLPQQNLNLEFLNSLPKNMMPNVDFSSLPQASQNTSNIPKGFGVEQNKRTGEEYFLQQLTPEQKAQNMIPERRDISYDTQDIMGNIQFGPGNQFGGNLPGYAAGLGVSVARAGLGGLRGRAANLAQKVLGKNKTGITKYNNFGAVPLPNPGQLANFVGTSRVPLFNTDRARRATELAIPAAAIAAADATQGFSEDPSFSNMATITAFSDAETLGRELAEFKIGFDRLTEIATQKAQEIGAAPGDYINRAKDSYTKTLERERMQAIDAQQGLKNFSFFLGPDMPFEQPEDYVPFREREEPQVIPQTELEKVRDTSGGPELFSNGGYAGGETTVTAPLINPKIKAKQDAQTFYANYIENPYNQDLLRREALAESLKELSQENQRSMSDQDLMLLQQMMDRGERQPYQMV